MPGVKEAVVEMLRIERNRFDAAIAILEGSDDDLPPRRRRSGPSIRTRLIHLLESADRSWTVTEALSALESQGQPVVSVDPHRLVATTLAALVRGRLAVRVGPGTYRAARFSAQYSATQPP